MWSIVKIICFIGFGFVSAYLYWLAYIMSQTEVLGTIKRFPDCHVLLKDSEGKRIYSNETVEIE